MMWFVRIFCLVGICLFAGLGAEFLELSIPGAIFWGIFIGFGGANLYLVFDPIHNW
jgi:hypothetical protein